MQMPKRNKYFLVHHDHKINGVSIHQEWYLREIGVDCNRKPSGDGIEVLYEAPTLPDMLHQIQNRKDWRFYTVSQTLSSRGRQRSESYPHHRHICVLAGFISEVCDLRIRDKCFFGEKWEIEYEGELWISPFGNGGNEMYRVIGFTAAMDRAVERFRKENNLEWGTTADYE
jgi:hypothetical protein